MSIVGTKYTGVAYRADTGYRNDRSATAMDVIAYEERELGNELNVPSHLLPLLQNASADQIVWMTLECEDAERYGEVEAYHIRATVVSEDGDGGYLMLIYQIGYPGRLLSAAERQEHVQEKYQSLVDKRHRQFLRDSNERTQQAYLTAHRMALRHWALWNNYRRLYESWW